MKQKCLKQYIIIRDVLYLILHTVSIFEDKLTVFDGTPVVIILAKEIVGQRAAKFIDADGVQLTAKEFAFCNFFLRYFNRSRAVIEAGYNIQHKEPRVIAFDLLHRDRVMKYLSIQLDVSLAREKASAIMDECMTSDLGEIYFQSGNSFNISKMHNACVSHLIKKYMVKIITKTGKDGTITVTEIVNVEREDKIRAAEVFAKLQGWIGNKKNVDLNVVPASQILRDRVIELKKLGI